MKTIFLAALVLVSCTHQKKSTQPEAEYVAFDSMADGLIEATAIKRNENQDVCFDITLTMKGVAQRYAASSNWTAALVDNDSRYHLLNLAQRDPASTPQGSVEKWMNVFRTCAPLEKLGNVKSLVLTPKTLPYRETEGMTLQWK